MRVRSLVARGLTVVLLAAFAALLAPPPVVQAQTAVPPDWSLIPSELGPSDTFRLVFLSSTKRNASSTDIADYNTFVQDRAAAGHVDIQAYSSGFRAVDCTADTDALDNTATNYTASDKGVPIYWLNGAKAADDYEDFYDGSWDEEVNDKNESGNDGPDTSLDGNHPFTGCEHDGTEAFFAGNSRALGNNGQVYVGVPDSIGANNGPIGGTQTTDHSNTRPLYGLSEVLQVSSAATVTVERNVGFTVTVDDDPDKSVRKQLIQVPEGGSREYQVNMTQAPTQGVRVSYRFQGRDSSISSATPRSHTFTAQNWETPWRITVDAAQDQDTFDGTRTIQHEVETDDPFYKRKSPRFVHIAEQDDDTDANGRVTHSEDHSGLTNPITATLEYAPKRHNGNRFWVIVRFSSPLKTGWEDMRDLAFTSDDAEVRQAFRVYGQKDLWAFLVYPREDDNTILVLEGARECSEAGAPCARGGRQLGNTLWIGIAGSDGEDATVHRLTIEEGGSFESQFASFHVRLGSVDILSF